MFTVTRRKHNRLLHITRSTYNNNCIINCNHNLKDMFVICNKFIGRKVSQVHPDLPSVEYFDNFFGTKIKNIIDTLLWPASSVTKIALNDSLFHSFDPPFIDIIIRLINSTKSVSIDDKSPLTLLHKLSIFCAPYIFDIIFDSFANSIFPSSMKIGVIKTILKKKELDKNNLNNYLPISQIPIFLN